MTASTLRLGAGVDRLVKAALARDPGFVHPDFVDHPAFVIRDGKPRQARIVGAIRRSGADYSDHRFRSLMSIRQEQPS